MSGSVTHQEADRQTDRQIDRQADRDRLMETKCVPEWWTIWLLQAAWLSVHEPLEDRECAAKLAPVPVSAVDSTPEPSYYTHPKHTHTHTQTHTLHLNSAFRSIDRVNGFTSHPTLSTWRLKVKNTGQSSQSQKKTTAIVMACATSSVIVNIAGGLWWIRLKNGGNVLWIRSYAQGPPAKPF